MWYISVVKKVITVAYDIQRATLNDSEELFFN